MRELASSVLPRDVFVSLRQAVHTVLIRVKMYDPDVIAYLFPVKGKGRQGAINTIYMKENAARFGSAGQQDDFPSQPAETLARSVREATEQPEEDDAQEDEPYLILTFSSPPKTPLGYLAGRCPDSDLVLTKYKGVSWYHFALTFDDDNCLIVRDLDSTVGTRVIYDTEDGERGHGIAWSARGPGLVNGKPPVIKVVGDLQFKLVVPNHDTSSKTYLDNVARFRQGTAATEDLFHGLKLLSPVKTELPTPMGEAETPGVQAPGSILWKKMLGQGSFAVVHYAWDVTTRQEYALKEPRPGKFDRQSWRKEVEIMKGISHVSEDMNPRHVANSCANGYSTQNHIVKLKYASFDDVPQLYFEYMPGGSLEKYLSVTTSFHNKQMATQLLSGLEHLHTQQPPVVHRDIKPENILVQAWSSEGVHVKLGDFGLSRQAEVLKTYCGSLLYAAPEIYCLPSDPKYSPLVDIWSVGVLLIRLECGRLPRYQDHYRASGAAWAEAVISFVQAHLRRHGVTRLLSFVLEDMLVVKPESRRTALDCHTTSRQLFGGERCETLIPSVELASFQATTDHSSPPSSDEDGDEENDPTTPRAVPADLATAPQDYGATIIASLGYRDTDAIDSWLGLQPSDMSEFQRSAGLSVETRRAAASLVRGDLWFMPLVGEEEGEEEETGKSSRTVSVEQTGDFTDSYIFRAVLGQTDNAVAVADKETDGSPDGQVLYKRPRWETNGSGAEGLVDDAAEDDVARKRSKVEHCGDCVQK
ncbi:MAG: hypothetical protein Q9216_007066 [Gyalolechia sp. 2 TL-2023]